MSEQQPSVKRGEILPRLVALSRTQKQGVMLLTDVGILLFAVWAAYALRLGHFFVPNTKQALLMAAAPILAVPIFVRFGLYRSVIRYVGEHALWTVMKGMTLAALLWAVLAFMTQMTGGAGVPRSVPLLYWMLGGLLIGGIRFVARWILWTPLREQYSDRQVLIYGAGNAGRQLAASLRQGREFFPAGFIDDDRTLHGKDVAGIRVYPPGALDKLIEQYAIHDVIVTMPSVSGARRKAVVEFLEQFPVKVQILPAMTDLASGRHLVDMVREVDISDLLGRDPVEPLPHLLSKCITGKVVLVTGAGGSIGSELCRQIAMQGPAKLILLDVSEHALYQIGRAVEEMSVHPVLCLGSVTDEARVSSILREHRVETIYHAAAYKHVPIVEANIAEGVRNNISGTRVMAEAALALGVETFVLISSDKAVRPSSVMGATKRWAELIVMEIARQARLAGKGQHFCAVRFGNVLGSSGSVIPLFKEQIKRGGPVTVTHPEVTRYFMSIHEAVELVIQAGSLSDGGEIFLLDMGEPMSILRLAENMIRLAGYEVKSARNPGGDIAVEIVGLRPGEKLFEELLIHSAKAVGTLHPKILRGEDPVVPRQELRGLLDSLEALVDTDAHAARAMLIRTAEAGPEVERGGTSADQPTVVELVVNRRNSGG